MAKRTKSGLKANRQNIKRREQNRQLRTRLRSTLRSIRASIDDDKLDEAKAVLTKTVSLVDKMASRGIIHRNAASRYKSRLTLRLQAG